jgi:hypothetical protein
MKAIPHRSDRDPSTAKLLRVREAASSLRMTTASDEFENLAQSKFGNRKFPQPFPL